jgi:hypothetical protein
MPDAPVPAQAAHAARLAAHAARQAGEAVRAAD